MPNYETTPSVVITLHSSHIFFRRINNYLGRKLSLIMLDLSAYFKTYFSHTITKNCSFTVNIFNKKICLIKGHLKNPIIPEKFDIKTRDSERQTFFLK